VLLGVPNFSEGRDPALVERITAQFAAGAELLDSHSDAAHNRTVLTLAAPPRRLGEALARGAGACGISIDMRRHEGAHPAIGALDVCPVVFPSAKEHDAARTAALTIAETIGGEGIPVFLYGELATSEERRERAYFRRGGLAMLSERMAAGELRPDSGPDAPHPMAGATLVTARPPLAAFNVVLEGAHFASAAEIAAQLRESGGGLPGVRAIAIDLGERGIQISTNIHDPVATPLAAVVGRIAELGARPASAEIVGLVPEGALVGLPANLPIPGFDRDRHTIERRLSPQSPNVPE
jgi:glutamate formiminotransferase / 5-formyltetrahydrofolate cyclo-ligase